MSTIPWDNIEREYDAQRNDEELDLTIIIDMIQRYDLENALKELKYAMESNPSNEEVVNLYVHCLRKNSQSIIDLETAINTLQKHANENSVTVMTQYNLGTLYMNLGRYEEALKQFEGVYSSDPANNKILYNIALCNQLLGRGDEALLHYQQAINLGNRSKKVLSNYVVLLCKLNRKEEAQTYLDELNEKHGDDPLVINNNIVILAINSGDKDIIRKNFQLLHDKNIDNPSVLYNEGVFEFHDSNVEISTKLFQRVEDESQGEPIKVFAQLNCAYALEKLNRAKESRRFYLKIIDHLGKFVDVSDIQQRVNELQNLTVTQNDKKKRKSGGRSSLIAYDADLMEFKNSFSTLDDPLLHRDLSGISGRSPNSLRDDRSYHRGSVEADSPTLLKYASESYRQLRNINEEEEMKEDKQTLDPSLKSEAKIDADADANARENHDSNVEASSKINAKAGVDHDAAANVDVNADVEAPPADNNTDPDSEKKEEAHPDKSTLKVDESGYHPSEDNNISQTPSELQVPHSQDVDHSYTGVEDWTKEMCIDKLEEDPNHYDANVRLGHIYMEERSYHSAIEYFTRCIPQRPIEIQDRSIKCLIDCYIYAGEFEKAMENVETLPRTRATKADYLLRKGLTYEGIGNTAEARKLIEQATIEDAQNPLTHLRFGSLLVRMDEIEAGIVSLRKACQLDKDNVEIRIKLAEALIMSREDHLEEALKHFKFVYEKDNHDYDALIGLSQVYEKTGNLEHAIEYAQIAARLQEAPVNCLFFLGTLYYKTKDLKKAEDLFRKVLKKEINHIGATIELATTLSVLKDFDKAKKYFKHAVKLDPYNIVANLRYGKILQTHLGEYDEAIECFQRIINVDESQFKAHYQLGVAYAEKKLFNESHEAFKECLKYNPNYAPAWKGIGHILFEVSKVENALKYFERALSFDAKDIEAKTQIGNCHYELKDYDAAIASYEDILKEEKTANILYNLGNSYFMKNDLEKAIEYYIQSLSIDDKRAECHYNLGNAYVIKGEYANSIEPFKKACNAYLLTDDLDNALKLFDNVIKLDPKNQEWRLRIAFAFMEKGDSAKALNHVEICLNDDPQNTEAIYLKAQILEKDGDLQDAINLLEKIADKQVGEEMVADRIAQIKKKL